MQENINRGKGLLGAGTLPALKDYEGAVLLEFAANRGADDAIEVLAAAAAADTLNHANEEGLLLFCSAAREGHESPVCVLLSRGASDKEDWMQNRRPRSRVHQQRDMRVHTEMRGKRIKRLVHTERFVVAKETYTLSPLIGFR
eukprot:g13348.t1